MKILLFTGAGASVELGIPAMRGMAEEFHAHLGNLELTKSVFERFEQMLPQSGYDIESLIELVESVEKGQESLRGLNYQVNEDLLSTSRTMRWEVEWFMQHVCERLRDVDAEVLWGAALRRTGDHELCVATSNYDRAIEIACRSSKVPFDDGFEEGPELETSRWRGISFEQDGIVRLLKVHGSTDWYLGDDGAVYKLRHSMPLYGNLALAYIGDESCSLPRMKSALILPTREKRITQPPYPDLMTDLRNAARMAEVAIFLGTSLRDSDIRDICRQCAERIPTFLVTVDNRVNDLNIPKLRTIRGTASGFLTSTLPVFLAEGEVEYLNDCSNGKLWTVGTAPVLTSIVSALEGDGGVDETCRAIDRLVDCGVMLDITDIKRLLGQADIAVRKYALAMIPKSVDRAEAMRLAQMMAANDGDVAFSQEFNMLQKLMD